MDLLLLTARVLHVVLGVFWAGTLIFLALFLGPSIRDAGPAGGAVMAGLMKRRFMDLLPAAAILTVLSGIWLFWHASAGLGSGYMRSGPGMAYQIGGTTALLAIILGITIVRPSTLRAMALSQAAASASGEEQKSALAQAQAFRMKAAATTRWVALLLAITVVMMAVGRYL
jgi:uncharacterized membrane protein